MINKNVMHILMKYWKKKMKCNFWAMYRDLIHIIYYIYIYNWKRRFCLGVSIYSWAPCRIYITNYLQSLQHYFSKMIQCHMRIWTWQASLSLSVSSSLAQICVSLMLPYSRSHSLFEITFTVVYSNSSGGLQIPTNNKRKTAIR